MKRLEISGWMAILAAAIVLIAVASCIFVMLLGLDAGQNQAIAAWVQGVGSILAVGATAYIPFLHSRHSEDKRRAARLQAAKSLAEQTVRLTEDLRFALSELGDVQRYLRDSSEQEWDELIVTLAAYPVWDAADGEDVAFVGPLREAVKRGRDLISTLNELPSDQRADAYLKAAGANVTAEIIDEWISKLLKERK